VQAACLAGDGVDPLDEAAVLRLRHDGLGETTRLWIAGDEGFALVRDLTLDLAVRPDARGRGLGRALAEAALAGAAPTGAWAHGDHPAARRLAAQLGFARVRELWVLRRPTAEPLPALVVPDGVTVRGFRPGDEESLLEVNAAAFAQHPEQAAMDAEDLRRRMAEAWFDPAGLLLAVDGSGDLLGFHWTKRHSTDLGEVYVVGVAPAAQGRGWGRILTLAGLHHLAGLGLREVLLYVESDNRPALALYTGLGFTHAATDTHVRYAATRAGSVPD
jgi:mycothiol synthase